MINKTRILSTLIGITLLIGSVSSVSCSKDVGTTETEQQTTQTVATTTKSDSLVEYQ